VLAAPLHSYIKLFRDSKNNFPACNAAPDESTMNVPLKRIMLVISPFAKINFADDTLKDQNPVLRFIEDNWEARRIGKQSFNAIAGGC
jgi:hypothetical protein